MLLRGFVVKSNLKGLMSLSWEEYRSRGRLKRFVRRIIDKFRQSDRDAPDRYRLMSLVYYSTIDDRYICRAQAVNKSGRALYTLFLTPRHVPEGIPAEMIVERDQSVVQIEVTQLSTPEPIEFDTGGAY